MFFSAFNMILAVLSRIWMSRATTFGERKLSSAVEAQYVILVAFWDDSQFLQENQGTYQGIILEGPPTYTPVTLHLLGHVQFPGSMKFQFWLGRGTQQLGSMYKGMQCPTPSLEISSAMQTAFHNNNFRLLQYM